MCERAHRRWECVCKKRSRTFNRDDTRPHPALHFRVFRGETPADRIHSPGFANNPLRMAAQTQIPAFGLNAS